MAGKKNAIVKVKPAVPAVRPKTPALQAADNNLGQALGPLKQFQSLLDFANKGGRAACWGIICSSAAVGIGLGIHAAALNYIGSIGMMIGIGVYGTRIFHRIKDPIWQSLMRDYRD